MRCELLKAELRECQVSDQKGRCKGMINKQAELIQADMQPLCCLVCSMFEGNMQLKPYQSLGKQAEDKDSYEAYKEKIDRIRSMNYEELYNIMRDAEDALSVLLRKESKANQSGIFELTKALVTLGTKYLKENNRELTTGINLQYTYEFIEQENKKVKA